MAATRATRPILPPTSGEMILRRITLWLGICSLSAAPSLTMSLQDRDEFPIIAQLLGLLTFAIAAGILCSLPRVRAISTNERLRRSVFLAYALRTVAASLPGALLFLDVLVGTAAMLSYALMMETLQIPPNLVEGGTLEFLGTYFLVLWQGVLLNVVVWIVILMAWTFQVIFMKKPEIRGEYGCPRCRYDLRSTPSGIACPECGDPKISHCMECGSRITTGWARAECPECGSTAGTFDPRSKSWVDRVPAGRLCLMTAGCMAWASLATAFAMYIL